MNEDLRYCQHERSDPDVWIEWRRVSTIQERRFEAR